MMEKDPRKNQKNPFINLPQQNSTSTPQSKIKERPYTVTISHFNNLKSTPYSYEEYYNHISTSKYRWYFCIPLILLEQFSKLTNIYFLVITLMQIFKEISNSNGQPITLIPLSFVIVFNGIKDFYEDWKRKRGDDEENNKEVEIYDERGKKFITRKWKHVHLGNIIKVKENEYLPADCVLLKTSEKNSICYVETKNLDGETNLKFKTANPHFSQLINKEEDICNLRGNIQCKLPNEFIYDFTAIFSFDNNRLHGNEGQRRYQQIKDNQQSIPSFEEDKKDKVIIDKDSFLLRGSSIMQTKYIYGLVVYVGHNTKIMKNSSNAKAKTSKVENIMNHQIIYIFIFQILLSSLGAGFSLWIFTQGTNSVVIPYISTDKKYDYIYFLLKLGTWIVLLNNLVPISLLFTMEMVKYIQGMFIGWDIEIFDKKLGIPAKIQTSTLNEELGQVKYIFSDKTGTLTQNHMQLKKMCIGNYKYGELNRDTDVQQHQIRDSYGNITNVVLVDQLLEMQLASELQDNYFNIDLFMKCLAICHNVFIDLDINDDSKAKQIKYNSPSPDDLSMVNCARYFKYLFAERDLYDNITLLIGKNERIVRFKVITKFDYTSKRKRMSVIVQDTSTDKGYLFIKGADCAILPKITQNSFLINEMKANLNDYAKSGLRTLVIAYREINKEELAFIKEQLNQAKLDHMHKDDLYKKLAEDIETDLFLLGITGVEDQIQDKVDEAIESFIEAGIKVWILTGDKKETAKSIAISTKLINDSFNLLEIEEDIPIKSIKQKISSLMSEYNSSVKLSNDQNKNSLSKNALIISSNVLSLILNDKELAKTFYSLASKCNSVICCRITPKQKAQIVKMMKQYEPQSTILAIGDGANDVNMITEAHVGIGILGVEGRQAARASDYSIGQFYYLKCLLLVHGRESYRKNSFTICYNFSKNYLFVIPQFILGFDSLFSGQTIYDPIIYQMYNIFFAQFPIIWYGIYDKQMSKNTLMSNPKLYSQGIKGDLFGFRRFWSFIFSGLFQAIILYCFCFKFISSPINSKGDLIDLSLSGSLTYTSVIIIVNLQVLTESYSHSFISIFLLIISISLYFGSVYLMSLFTFSYIYANFYAMCVNLNVYGKLGCIIAICLVIQLGINSLLRLCGVYQDPLQLNQNAKQERIDIENTENSQLTQDPNSPKGSDLNITELDMGDDVKKNDNGKYLIN